MNPISRFKNIFFDYSLLFKTLKKEGIVKSLVFYWFFVFVLLLINWALLYNGEIPANLSILKQLQLTEKLIFEIPIHFFLLNVIIIFFLAGFAELFSGFYKNKTKFSDNIKIFGHSSVVFVLTSWISVINALFALWSVYLAARGISEINNIGFRKSFYIALLASVFAATVSFIGVYIIALNSGIDLDLERIFISRT